MAARRKSPETRIAELEEQERQIRARLQREKARLREDERKRDTRRKIIAGALALEHKDPAFQAQLARLIQEYVTRPEDRALFDLEPLPQESPSPASSASGFAAHARPPDAAAAE